MLPFSEVPDSTPKFVGGRLSLTRFVDFRTSSGNTRKVRYRFQLKNLKSIELHFL